MEEEREEGGISIGEIFRVIFSQKWLVLIITAVIAVAGTLGIYFGMNNSKREYVASFVLNLPGDDKTQIIYTYPDGTQFYYSDLVSAEILKEVKASDSAFDDIEVEAMANDGNISIVRTENQQKTEVVYTINVKANYFKNKEVARRFITKLANVPGSHLAEMNIAYDNKISNVEDLTSYENMITAFEEQCTYLTGQYTQLTNQYKSDFIIRDGKTLNSYKTAIETFKDKNRVLEKLKTQVKDEHLLKSIELKADYENELVQVERNLKREQFILDEMKVGSSDVSQNVTAVRDQAAKVADLMQRKEDLEKYIAEGKLADEAFKTAIDEAYETVKGFTADFKYAAETVYSVALTVSFATSNVITTEGETGLIISFAISLVAGLIIAMIVGYIVGRVKLGKKAAKAAPATANVSEPAEAEVLAQAAATDAEEDKTKNKK
ncbi:MAG: hypothetical protein K2G38_03405 [Clostridia bacterium]|nr:hypothetical protein [Clostridia bacterium]